MAVELVCGALISVSVQVLLERIASPLVVAYLRGKLKHSDSEGLFRRLRISVSSVTAVLDDAEQKRMRRARGVQEWLDELQEAVFDAEDLLDEIETEALRRKVEAEPRSGSRTKAHNLYVIKKKCHNLFSRSRTKRKIEKILARMEDIVSKKDLLGLKHVVEKQMSQRIPSTSLVEESEIYGRDEEKDDVIKLLLSESNDKAGVIPIVGMGGLGKTTLAQLV